MIRSILFGMASAAVGARKYKFALAGLNFAYLGYRMLRKKKKQKEETEQGG